MNGKKEVRDYMMIREKKKEEVKVSERDEVSGIKTEQEVWKYVNWERKSRRE